MFLDKAIFNKTKVPVLKAALDVTQLRQRVISNNIANVGTKGFRRQDVRFEDYLESFVRCPSTGLNDSGLNNVDIDMEMADLAENHLFFNVSQRLISGQFNGLRRSITGRPA